MLYLSLALEVTESLDIAVIHKLFIFNVESNRVSRQAERKNLTRNGTVFSPA